MLKADQDFAGVQIQGDRVYQEDAQGFTLLVEADGGCVEMLLTVLADGMGGENAGGHASASVVRSVADYCQYVGMAEKQEVPEMLAAAVQEATLDLSLAIQADPELAGMGTTLLAVVVEGDQLYWISVGDSPLYLYRDGRIEQLNEDHSMMPLLLREVEQGYLDERLLKYHPDRNALRSALTGRDVELIDCPAVGLPLQSGDVVVIASDGLQTMTPDEIAQCLDEFQTCSAEEISQRLVEAVCELKQPRQDNTSVNVIKIPSQSGE
ncbi:serine/threonine-protein phosphatase [Verrucomicrobiaceae bacterium R5-34]|nr:serine/threonine-protein phosphatase [Verrucomicrobiaceae bacterium R5-34]